MTNQKLFDAMVFRLDVFLQMFHTKFQAVSPFVSFVAELISSVCVRSQ